ncbi:hypothetical protein Tco_0697296 [Tanacetum coccineum]
MRKATQISRSSSIATENEVTETMLVDAESGYSSKSDNEYKEPWRFLMHKSLGEEKEYVETKMNTALKIALSASHLRFITHHVLGTSKGVNKEIRIDVNDDEDDKDDY